MKIQPTSHSAFRSGTANPPLILPQLPIIAIESNEAILKLYQTVFASEETNEGHFPLKLLGTAKLYQALKQ